MGLKSQLVKLINSLVPDNTINSSDGVVKYGLKNLMPQEILNAVSDSGTASSCVAQLKSFIEADGFTKEFENKMRVNAEQNAQQLLADIAYDQAIFNGFYLKILFNLQGDVGSVEKMPFEKMRVTEDGDYVYNHTLGTKNYKESKNIYYEPFDNRTSPQDRVRLLKSEIKKDGTQKGKILFCYTKNPYSHYYPVPEFYAGIDDIKSDAGLTKLEYRNINRGFRPNVIISTVGEINNTEIDQTTGKTDAQIFDENLMAFTGEDAATILHLQSSTKDGLPEVVQFPLADLLDGVDKATDRVARKVARHFNVPPVLIGLSDAAVLGNQQAMANGMKLFNHSILTDQNLITGAFKYIYPAFDWTLTTLNLIDFIPNEILSALTQDEKRAIAGYDAIPTTDTGTGISLAEVLGVGGTQALQNILIDTILTKEQKIQILQILFNLTEEKAKLMVYGSLNPIPQPNVN